MDITEHRTSSERHSTFYRACGPQNGPLIIMTHGWPELSISWRHQLAYLGNLGYRAIAPDMRGTVPLRYTTPRRPTGWLKLCRT